MVAGPAVSLERSNGHHSTVVMEGFVVNIYTSNVVGCGVAVGMEPRVVCKTRRFIPNGLSETATTNPPLLLGALMRDHESKGRNK